MTLWRCASAALRVGALWENQIGPKGCANTKTSGPRRSATSEEVIAVSDIVPPPTDTPQGVL